MSDCFQKRPPSRGLGTRYSMLHLWVENSQVQETAQTSTVSWLNQHSKPLEPMLMCDLFESSKYIPTPVLDTVTCDNLLWNTRKNILKILNTERKIIVPITTFSWLLPVRPFAYILSKMGVFFLTYYRWKIRIREHEAICLRLLRSIIWSRVTYTRSIFTTSRRFQEWLTVIFGLYKRTIYVEGRKSGSEGEMQWRKEEK